MNSPSAEFYSSEIESLEKRLGVNPHSPIFARLANLYLDSNRLEDARILCERGISYYPEYATAHLILGKCYLHLQRLSDAEREFTETLSLQPQCSTARRFLDEIRVVSAAGTAIEVALNPEESPASVEERVNIERAMPSSESGRAIQVEPAMIDAPRDEIVTPTLAEIYASQGAYQEAIRTYTLLLRRRPGEKERFEQRIKELEERWRSVAPPN